MSHIIELNVYETKKYALRVIILSVYHCILLY